MTGSYIFYFIYNITNYPLPINFDLGDYYAQNTEVKQPGEIAPWSLSIIISH